ncbi:hypothetical protein AWENTII_008621 [Aspergillus wentii]|nr:hypothetical protein MW887_005296 [Aspergillus wentii]
MPPQLTSPIKTIQGVRIPGQSNSQAICDITISYPPESPEGTIAAITPHGDPNPSSTQDITQFPLIVPTLTHPHIHLDKAFIHSAHRYAHLRPSAGSFQEALSFTTQAKEQFTKPDLRKRGEWLLAESLASGVAAMRAFVEVDHTVKLNCLETGLQLKDEWKDSCQIQVVSFAQDPIFSGEYADENKRLMESAVRDYPQTDVIGTTPYVESSVEAAKRNIDWTIEFALENDKHVDFHLDYNLDKSKDAMVWHVLHKLNQKGWTAQSSNKRVMLGHCTRLTLFADQEWSRLAQEIHENDLPVSFVGLPTSDLYMASPPNRSEDENVPPHERSRGTLQIPHMIRKHDLDAVIGVNNVGNAFTPWGSPDPLSLACLGVGIYQAGTQADAELLYECVSTRARAAIGLSNTNQLGSSLEVKEGSCPDFLLIYNVDETGCQAPRARESVAEVVWDPSTKLTRDVVSSGRLMLKPMAEQRASSSPRTVMLHEAE